MKKKDYESPSVERSIVKYEGTVCSSLPVTKVQATVEVDPWVTIENDVAFD